MLPVALASHFDAHDAVCDAGAPAGAAAATASSHNAGAKERNAPAAAARASSASTDVTQQPGAASSSSDHGSYVDAEEDSEVTEYRKRAGGAHSGSVRRALVKAALVTSPIAVALLAAQQL